MYDAFVSLGYNCEVSFRLEDYFGSIDAMPFSWSYEMDRNKFVLALRNMDGLFAGEVRIQEDNMFMCMNYDIKFHPRYNILLMDGRSAEESRQKAEEELRDRVAYLKQKFKELLLSGKNTLFLMKVQDEGDESNCGFVRDVLEALEQTYASKNFTLVAVLERGAAANGVRLLESERLKVRTLRRFAPKKHTDISGDVIGWWRLLNELAGERHYTYFPRLYARRWKWFAAVAKKHLHRGFGRKSG